MYAWLRTHLPERTANLTYVVVMAVLIALTVLLAGFPESELRYARL